jgi:hypothetical protein
VILACDYKRHRIVAVNQQTEEEIGSFGASYLAYPNGIWVDEEAGVIYVADSHDNLLRVTVFKLDTFEYLKQCVFASDKVSQYSL